MRFLPPWRFPPYRESVDVYHSRFCSTRGTSPTGARQIVDRQGQARACGKLHAPPSERETLSLQAKKGGCIPPKHRIDLLQTRSGQ
jgi:hypothetical protein